MKKFGRDALCAVLLEKNAGESAFRENGYDLLETKPATFSCPTTFSKTPAARPGARRGVGRRTYLKKPTHD